MGMEGPNQERVEDKAKAEEMAYAGHMAKGVARNLGVGARHDSLGDEFEETAALKYDILKKAENLDAGALAIVIRKLTELQAQKGVK